MGINFRKIFARKAKEIAAQVDEGQRLLDDAQAKICKLKCAPKAVILKNEIKSLVDDLCRTERDVGRISSSYGMGNNERVAANEIRSELRDILNELCELAERGER